MPDETRNLIARCLRALANEFDPEQRAQPRSGGTGNGPPPRSGGTGNGPPGGGG